MQPSLKYDPHNDFVSVSLVAGQFDALPKVRRLKFDAAVAARQLYIEEGGDTSLPAVKTDSVDVAIEMDNV